MKYISYAQNFEDVILKRALKHIEKGFYIDVGAAWPIQHSVTKAFYDSGWRGINIEPNPDFFLQYASERPEDINLQLAVSDKQGEEVMNFINDTGLSTMNHKITEVHYGQGYSPNPRKVNVTTLNEIFIRYIENDKDVHFLKIDVEGLEPLVISGCDWKKNRPWIVVVEATVPMSQELNHFEWESILIEADYIFVYMDGLNRYYISEEHKELAKAFSIPPNVFDNFILHSELLKDEELVKAKFINKELKKELKESNKICNEHLKVIELQKHENWALRHQIALIHSSKFWRFGMPFRVIIKCSGKLYRFIKYYNKKESPKAFVRFVIRELQRYPNVKAAFKKIIQRTGLKNIISKAVYNSINPPIIHQANKLSPKAEVIKLQINSSKADVNKSSKD